MKVCFITYGCRLNRAEALDEEARYLAAGWQLTESHAEANRFVLRGCSVTSRAQAECEKMIAHLRRKYPNVPLVVEGCLKRDASPQLSVTLPNDAPPPVPVRTARAFLKIQDGCSGKCTFCIVPKFRGASVSVAFADVLDHARRLIDAGYGEIVLTGCNLVLYASAGKRLPDLVAALSDLGASGVTPCRFRLGSIEPGACAEEVVRVMAERPNVCKDLHLPVQSGSSRVLMRMRRPYLVKDIERVVDLATGLMPRLGLGCDMLSGFPGETELDHAATKALLSRLPFTHVHAFPYSERPGTTAATLGERVHHADRTHRAHEIMRLIAAKREAFARKFIGSDVEVIIENEKEQTGWTSEYLPFRRVHNAPFRTPTPRKGLATFRITASKADNLLGR